MNKATKIIVILMITTIVLYTIVGIYKTKQNELSKENDNASGESLNSGDDTLDEERNKISYEITSGDNEVVLKGLSEGTISITTYKFVGNKLMEIILSEEIISGDEELVEKIYNHMKEDENMSRAYSSIERNGMIITANLKSDYIDSYGEAGKEEIYNELIKSFELSE